MLIINKISLDRTIDYASEELAKYLRMMMPEAGEAVIRYNPDAKEGFRLGLMQDFGLDVSDVEESSLDDILYIDTTGREGIIAGDNPRSVLLSVYEYFRQNGCRWLMPGVDGEFIPMQEVVSVKYRHVPSMRYRGWCNEGAYTQQNMVDMIEFTPKVGMNFVNIQFFIPRIFYHRYYAHWHNDENRIPEPVSAETVIQWKCHCEEEILKRGLVYSTGVHGFNCDPFGISSASGWGSVDPSTVSEHQLQYMAMINGSRQLTAGCPLMTQFCMSNSEARRMVVDYTAGYCERNSHIKMLVICLGDADNNHCECEECQKKIPTDWYVILMNELDEELTKREIPVKLVVGIYSETCWAPQTETFNHPERYILMLATITRSYTKSISSKNVPEPIAPYVRNSIVLPQTLKGYFSCLEDWRKMLPVKGYACEYHFWEHQFLDPSGLTLANRLAEDISAYQNVGIDGLCHFISVSNFFPHGFAFYVNARLHFDRKLTMEELKEEYFSCAYGEYAKEVLSFFEKVEKTFDFAYMEGEKGLNGTRFYNPQQAETLKNAQLLSQEGKKLADHIGKPSVRVQSVFKKLLSYYSIYISMLGKFMEYKALGDNEKAKVTFEEFKNGFGKFECEIDNYYDHFLAFKAFLKIYEDQDTGMR